MPDGKQPLHYWGSAKTHPGMVRNNNQDHIYLLELDTFLLAIVADGMGGAAGGEEASRIAIETIQSQVNTEILHDLDRYVDMDSTALAIQLANFVTMANVQIVSRSEEDPSLKGMGTTLTLAFIRQDELILAHVGDSRAYIYREDESKLEQLTVDHSFVQALVQAGHLSPDEASMHPMKNVLYRALGQMPEMDVDIYANTHVYPGDRLLLCSDGLTLHVEEDEIQQVIETESNPFEVTKQLVDLANERGGKDNISVIVVGDFDTKYRDDELSEEAPHSQDQTAAN